MLVHALVHSFLLLSNPVTVCPLPTDGHSSCFQFLSTKKNYKYNLFIQVFMWTYVWISLG